ncbi:MAG: 16S rRNA (cytosine(1402)-N(4))-methyltransferase RsmH [Clostridia bacterium]|nr:16S rRNA (cytosine(1402)-N(4))-methyltransferase RsmH [Clostridia bacterium]
MSEFHHIPVLLNECLEGLSIKPSGVYLDGTLGGGGHSVEILKRLGSGHLYGIDRDAEALAAAGARIEEAGLSDRFTAVRGNFHDAHELLAQRGVESLDGALLDLGVSSHQLDERSRGFSYQGDDPLDMRMDTDAPLSARDIVNSYSQNDICRILSVYGEEKWAMQIARVICDRRQLSPIETTGQLVDIIDAAIPRRVRERDSSHPARRTFQALRIAVNDELEPLENALRSLSGMLKPGGRLCVIAFHSLEDRIVKTTFKDLADPCTCPKSFPVCVCGKKPTVKLITHKPIQAGEEELSLNPRARSATLRIVEKL